MSQGIAGRLLKGSIWITSGRLIANLLAVASTLIVARMLTPEDFGLVALATTMLAIVTAVTDVAMNDAIIRNRAPTEFHFSSAFTVNALRGLLVSAIFFAAALPAAALYEEPRLVAVMIALGASALLAGLTNPRRVMLQRDLIFWQDFVLNVAQKFVGALTMIAIAVVYRSYWALVAGIIAAQLVNVLLSYAFLPFRPRVTLRHARELMSFSVWLTLAQILNTINWRFDHLLIGKFLGRADLGFYSVGSNLASIPTRETVSPLTQAIFPGFTQIASDPARLAAGYQRTQAVVTAVALPLGATAAMLADPLVRLVLGAQWVPAIFVVEVLAFVIAFQTLGSLVQPLAMALGETRPLFVRSAQMLAFRVPVVGLGLHLDGLRGVVVARVVSGLVGIAVDMFLVRRFTGLGLGAQLAVNLRAFVAVGVLVAATATVGHVVPFPDTTSGLIARIALQGATALTSYCAATALLWWVSGRPQGPETQLAALVAQAYAGLRRLKGHRP
jgi:lipopolysaccharide exporter